MNTSDILAKTGNFTHPKTCPTCQHTNYTFQEDIRFLYCYNCGTTSDLTYNKQFTATKKIEDFPYYSFLRVGQKVLLEEKEFIITSRWRYRSSHKEYYSDSEGSGYSNETWYFDTYVLRTKTGEKYFLTEDKEGYYFGMPISVDHTEADPQNLPLFTNFYDNRVACRVTEYGYTTLEFFEGESDTDNPPAINNTVYFATYQEGIWAYTVEQGDGWKEFSAEKKISKKALYHALRENPYIKTYQEREKGFSIIRKSVTWAAVISFLVFLVSLASDGSPIFKQRVSVKDIDKETGYLSKPFKIEDLGTNYNIEWGIDFKSTVNQGMYVVIEILNKDKAVVNAVESDFWYESGTDSEGSWTESERSSSKYFRFTEKGEYYTRLYAQADSSYFKRNPSEAIIEVTVNKGALMSRYFIILSGLLSVLAMCITFGALGRKAKMAYISAGLKN